MLDARLRTAADWVTPCGVCADIGCDHGRLGTALLLEHRCQHLLAADVSAKALDKARARVRAQNLAECTTFVHADGLSALDALPDGKADTVCILGMGGDTLSGILRRGQSRLQGAKLILGAQTELPTVREAIQRIGYRLQQERVVAVDQHLYLLMLALPAQGDEPPYTAAELALGPCLLHDMPAQWRPWLERRERLLSGAVAAMQASGVPATETRHAASAWELAITRDALAKLADP
ncbi:MAG: class I SAM-dependent methyltransferase [Candidatus Limiplasma sp.]|nr:class I SAM-dependent methyltransferase [Candidatus Limiplasma sp.]